MGGTVVKRNRRSPSTARQELESERDLADFPALVRDALRHVHDPVYLRTHPLVELLALGVGEPAGGKRLQQLLLDTIAALATESRLDMRASRRHELLALRYVEALEIGEVASRLGMSRREYSRQHRLALTAVVWSVQDSRALSSAPEAQSSVPDANGSDPSAAHLPLFLTSFVGRDAETMEVLRLIETARLVTLTGPPGTGKTRLAVHIAAELSTSMDVAGPTSLDRVFYVPLASIADPDLVVSSIAETMAVREAPGSMLLESLADHLVRRRTLLVLDNFEHVLAAAPTVLELLAACPQLTVLVTSREALHLSGEHEFPVPPLQVPQDRDPPTVQAIAENEAVRLYVERASAKRPGFQLSEHNAPAIGQLCRRLDGLPLAIELAAARSPIFPPDALLKRLVGDGGRDIALDLLKGGPNDMPDRQRTLRDAIDWSYRLLTDVEQQLFAQLSIFAGGWMIEDAEAVCAVNGRLDILDGMTSLVDKSLLLQVEIPGSEPHFSMLETLREYAAERLVESGEEETARDRHATHFVHLGQDAHSVFNAAAQPAWLDLLEREHNNMRAALSWLLTRGDGEAALRLVAGLWWYWMIRGHVSEGRRQIDRILAITRQTLSAERAEVLMGASHLAMMQEDFAAAETYVAASIDLAREVGDDTVLGDALMTQGLCALRQGDVHVAKRTYEESLPLARQLGREQRIAIATRALGAVAQREGDVVKAIRLIEESVGIQRTMNDVWELSTDYLSLGLLAAQLGELERAEALFRDSLQFAVQISELDKIAYVLDALAGIAVTRGEFISAARRLAAAEALWNTVEVEVFRKTVEVAFPDDEKKVRQEWEATVRARLGDDWEGMRQEASRIRVDEAVAWALHGPN